MNLQRNACPRPRNFTPCGELVSVEWSLEPPLFDRKGRRSRVQKLGMSYEYRAQDALEAMAAARQVGYMRGPWLRLVSRTGGLRWCQPDAFIVDFARGKITVVEIKLRHTSDAWWQLRRLYEPAARALFGPLWGYSALEVVKWYDGTISFPEHYHLAPSPFEVRDGQLGVHILSPGAQRPAR